MNNAEVPIFKTGSNKSIILSHSDLDGCNALQVCHKWLKDKLGHDHVVEYKNMIYDYINGLAATLFKESDEYRYILIADISISEELVKIMPKNCFIFDHHDTSKYLENYQQCYWKHGLCGSVVAWKALYPHTKPTPAFGKLMSICNNYDMWQGDPEGGPPQISFDMNAIYFKTGYTKFFEKFYSGFDGFDELETKLIKDHWNCQENVINVTDKLEYSEQVMMLIVSDQRIDANYWCNHFIKLGKLAVFVYYPYSNRLSLRINKCLSGKFHGGYFLREVIKKENGSAGGHELAAGCSVAGLTDEEILNLGNVLIEHLPK
jgi:hypothetical protein